MAQLHEVYDDDDDDDDDDDGMEGRTLLISQAHIKTLGRIMIESSSRNRAKLIVLNLLAPELFFFLF